MEQKELEIFNKYADYQTKQMILKLYIVGNKQIAYMGTQADKMFNVLKAEGKLNNLEDEFDTFIKDNFDLLNSLRTNEELKKEVEKECKISVEKQREIAFELIGKRKSIEELYGELN